MKCQSLIWDLDGTLLDSYGVIVAGLHDALLEHGIDRDPAEIRRCVARFSIGKWLDETSAAFGIPRAALRERYSELSEGRYRDIVLMPHAREILEQTARRGIAHYVYTHRGKTTAPVLEHLGIASYFTEVVTILDGFGRKPCPDAVLRLTEKYRLDRDRTCYVGDRSLDIQCARNAGIHSILYLPRDSCSAATGEEDAVVQDLMEIGEIIKD